MKFNPDCSLIKEWDGAVSTLPCEAPFVSKFNLASKRLHYIAAQHGGDIDSPTLKTVKQEFDSFKPDVVIVEGIPNTGEKSPAWYLKHCGEQAKTNYAVGGEGAYATVLAGERNIDFIPGEPSAQNLYEGILEQGYAREDLLGWQIAGMIKHRLNAGVIDESNMVELTEQWASSCLHEINQGNVRYNFGDFCNWYQDRMGRRFSLENIAADDGSPSTDPNANFLQKMMSATDKVREPHILKIIAEQLEAHNKVLVVYGSAHAGKHEPVLKKMLGSVQYSKSF